jgi:hypothetical protein
MEKDSREYLEKYKTKITFYKYNEIPKIKKLPILND